MRFRFDFGCASVKKGYIKIAQDTIYTDEKGYGISEYADAIERKTGEKEVLRDFLLFDKKSFKVKIYNGLYNVRVSGGDYEDNGDVTLKMTINDSRHGIWINDHSVGVGLYKINVENNVMQFYFEGRYVCVNSIDIAPVLTETMGEIKANVIATKDTQAVNLKWDKLSSCTAYRIYRKNLQNSVVDNVFKVCENSFTDTNVALCEKYEYTVVGLDEYDFETDKTVPLYIEIIDGKIVANAPCNLVDITNESSVSLNWDSVENAVSYNVYQKAPYGSYKKIACVNSCDYTDNDVKTVVEFIYAVEGVTPSGITKKAEITTPVKAPAFKRKMETLNRGLVAVKTAEGVFLSWRLNAYEYDKNIDFHLFRNGERITDTPVTQSTNYLDKAGTANDLYTVKAVCGKKMEKDGFSTKVINGEYLSIPLDKPTPFTTPDGIVYEYSANDASIADLDGDGEYEIILKWACGDHDNSHTGYSGIVYLDGYKLDGTRLWRINLGINIRAGAHYTQFMVYDLNNDGKAEIVCKTADGTIDNAGNVIGDINADWRNKDGFIIEGPEYLTAFNGETGEIIDTVDYDPPRGNVAEWGDSWGNRVDRFLACVAYLDGENPSVVMCRGYYDHGCPTVLVAYDLIDNKLIKRWKFLANKNQNIEYTNQGNHNLGVGDIDGDGRDEIVYGACAIDHDGTGMYSTGLEHGDAMHLGKFTTKTPSLDFFQIHEHAHAKYGYEVRNPATGEIKWGKFTGRDTARGLCANIDPRYEGNEVWAIGEGLYSFDGELITEKAPKSTNFAIWWDGDLLRELLDHDWHGNYGIAQIYKWDWENNEQKIILDTKDAYSINWTKGNPCIQASILGDWREDAIWPNKESTELRLYTTTHLTKHKFYTLMHDPVYRLAIAWQNTAYNQPPHTGFYIGDGMEKPPVPNSVYVRGENIPEFTEDIE